jgi:hypothetical protein
MATGDRSRLGEEYERLRSYVLFPAKPLSRPLGLDLWCKKGALSWIAVMLPLDNTKASGSHAPVPSQFDLPGATSALPISLANMIIGWSEING